MKTYTKTFSTVRGEETIVANVFEMDAAEAMAYEQENARFRVEFTVNGTPRGMFFHSGGLGMDFNDPECVTHSCLARHHQDA